MGKGAQMEKEISIIIRQTNERMIQRVIGQLEKLDIPSGYSVDVQIIKGAKSLAAAYNEGMKNSRAAYKLYIDEAVAVLNPTLLFSVIGGFCEYPNAGMIGWYGSEIPIDGDISRAVSLYGIYCQLETSGTVYVHRGKNPIFFQTVDVVDGAVIATHGDGDWDDSVGDYFAIAAQCCKRKTLGQETIVLMQNDCSVCQIERKPLYIMSDNKRAGYEKERRVFFERYKNIIQPLVSVIIPTYNQPEFVTAALESALAQDYGNIEIVVGDDSTTQDTKKIMEDYVTKYANIRYYYHGGPLGGHGLRNISFVLNHSRGEYVNYLLHDDLYRPTKISKMMKYYKQDLEETIGIVTSSRNVIDENGTELAEYANAWLPGQDVVEDGETIGRRIIMFLHNYIGEMTTVLLRKRDLKQLTKETRETGEIYKSDRFFGYIDTSMGDVSMWLELARQGKKCVFVREVLSSVRNHSGQNSHNPEIITGLILDWLAFVVLSWINGAFFRSADECRKTLVIWRNFFLARQNLLKGTTQEFSAVNSLLKETALLMEKGRYGEACLGIIDDIKKRQPEGNVIIPNNYVARCESINNELL